LALSSNSGIVSESELTWIPDLSARLGYQVAPNLRVYIGYLFFPWPGVFCAANQIDPFVNPALLPPSLGTAGGQLRPLFPDRSSSLWIHGVSIGMEVQF
jgi:hypothetical protein